MSRIGRTLGLGVLCLVAGCGKAPEDAAQSPLIQPKAHVAPTPSPEAERPAGTPPDQNNLLGLIAAAGTDDDAFKSFCTVFQKTHLFDNWAARVSDVRVSTVNQSIDTSFNIGSGAHIEQVVQTTNPLYATVNRLKVGQGVRVSGSFSHTGGAAECTYYLGPYAVNLSQVR